MKLKSITNLIFPSKDDEKKQVDAKIVDDTSNTDSNNNELTIADDDEKHRETWSGRFDFFLSALGYAVGLGAVWRFPYLCYRNGGGVFLIPYFVFLFLVGIPLVFLELCVGQFTSEGPLTAWTMVPLFRGIGLSMNIVNGYLNIYYNMIIAYSLYFFILSLNSKLPWQNCNPNWNVSNCVDDYSPDKFKFDECNDNTTKLSCPNGKCFNLTSLNGLTATCNMNESQLQQIGWWNPTFPSQIFWNKVILQKSSGIDNSDGIVWQLLIALAVAWLIVFAMVVRGIKVSGKLVYFTSLFPYVVLLILGIRGWVLPGAAKGIRFYIFPDFSRLADISVWSDAASQIFFTLSVSYGGLVALSSYNKFSNNVMRDAIVVSLSNCLTSVFAGFVVFAYIGYLSHTTGQDIDKVIQPGQGLSFVVYPYAVTTIPAAPLWSVLFFIMMMLLGLDTMMAGVETTITSILDIFTFLKKNRIRKTATIFGINLFYFLFGFLFVIRSGTYWIEMFDTYSGNWAVLTVGALECISVSWFYGFGRFKKDISLMIGSKTTNSVIFYVWNILWFAISPALLLVVIVLAFKDLSRIKLGNYEFPYWTHVLGEFITASTLSGVIFWAVGLVIYYLVKKIPLINLIKPDYSKWKPRTLKHRKLMYMIHGLEMSGNVPEKLGIDNASFSGEMRF